MNPEFVIFQVALIAYAMASGHSRAIAISAADGFALARANTPTPATVEGVLDDFDEWLAEMTS